MHLSKQRQVGPWVPLESQSNQWVNPIFSEVGHLGWPLASQRHTYRNLHTHLHTHTLTHTPFLLHTQRPVGGLVLQAFNSYFEAKTRLKVQGILGSRVSSGPVCLKIVGEKKAEDTAQWQNSQHTWEPDFRPQGCKTINKHPLPPLMNWTSSGNICIGVTYH